MQLEEPIVFISYAHEDRAFAHHLCEDLRGAGHAAWMDTADIRGGDRWVRTIGAAIGRCHAFVTVVSRAGNASEWVEREILHAQNLGRPIVPVLAEPVELPLTLANVQYIDMHADRGAGLEKLLGDLAVIRRGHRPQVRDRRALELSYLDGLRFGELVHTETYTPMAGTAQLGAVPKRRQPLRSVVMHSSFDFLERLVAGEQAAQRETRRVENVLEVLADVPRVALLGEPGAGKSTTLWRIARDRLEVAAKNPKAPLPLLVRLGDWTSADEPLVQFIGGQFGDLGPHVETMLGEGRALLLLDGLNETPVAQRALKAKQVRSLMERFRDVAVIVTCRELDYTGDLDLDLDRVVIRPLDAHRIRDFIGRYLDDSKRAEDMFWKLAGGEGVRGAWAIWEEAGVSGEFWTASEIPKPAFSKTTQEQDRLWREAAHDDRSLIRLAANPYMLWMLTQVYNATGDLPPNRGRLFEHFALTLLVREKLADEKTGEVQAEGRRLMEALAELGYAMQTRSAKAGGDASVVTALPRAEAARQMGEGLLHAAASASFLAVGDEVRFTHQLLQEFFAARGMRRDFDAGRAASTYWPAERFWERTNWEEVAVLLAGISERDGDRVLDWLAAASPEVAADVALRGGVRPSPELLDRLKDAWVPRLTDESSDPAPEARAAVGRALGLLGIDDRPGVGLRADGAPNIEWIEIPGGPFTYQDGRRLDLPTFHIARYCVTHAQFQAFVDAEDGYRKDAWWVSLGHRPDGPNEARWRISNHPRETVSWFAAVAFCRWLAARLRFEVRLPSEQEWEKAARGVEGREYPWGVEYVPGCANIDEVSGESGPHYIKRTTAVGIYPGGDSSRHVSDLSGNVWEWTGTDYDSGKPAKPKSNSFRVLRGGSWFDLRNNARAAYRDSCHPDLRLSLIGFRVVCSSPISR